MSKVRILVVDDAKFTRDLIIKTLRGGFGNISIDEAAHGRKAQALLSGTVYDLVLCDWEMPEMSGIELLQWVRGEANQPDLPFILVTSQGDKEHVVQAIEHGVNDYIGKPFSAEHLTDKVTKQLARIKKLKQAQGNGMSSYDRNYLSDNNPLVQYSGSNLAAKGRPSRRQKAGATRVKGELRWEKQVRQTLIQAINRKEAQLLLKQPKGYPALLAPVELVFTPAEGEPELILQGFVRVLQAVEKRVDTPLVLAAVQFTETDTQMLERLGHYVGQRARG